jgi:S-adenosylmethionine hydrolase
MHNSIITLTTDFGWRDSYVAQMKGAILNLCPKARIVDITHQIEKFNITMGAHVLASAAPHFPSGTIHVAVIDPGVGTKRKAIIIQTENAFFIGPDNGLLSMAAGQKIMHIYTIKDRKLMLSEISSTFHGRDIFCAAAGHLANGVSPSDLGTENNEIVKLGFDKVEKKLDCLTGQVIHIDNFGNIITNLSKNVVKSMVTGKNINLQMKNAKLKLRLCQAYEEVEAQKTLAIIGSQKFLEISINHGDAARIYRVKVGDRITVYRS